VAQGRAKAFPEQSSTGVVMPRGLFFLILVILLLAGGIYLLSSSADEVPVQTVEGDVTANASAN
jgi:hypothetical protein